MKTVINNYKVTKTFSEEHSKLITISKRKFSTKVVSYSLKAMVAHL